MNVRLLEVAQKELDEAVSHYNDQSPGLGDAFVLEAVSAIDRIRRFPQAWHPMGEEIRRCRLRRFPYGLIYSKDEEGILILAVAHTHREPGYWRDRVRT
ncbi:MAG TPA: type II toxin-antitoxin system RelE/ParE family toxin [Burkholderiales bacterium]|nr:type II toxin-antitoxin system RelE/ParE family toxin [Burkholderiales bacterium]